MDGYGSESLQYNTDLSIYDDDYTLQEDVELCHELTRDFEPLDSETDYSRSYASPHEAEYVEPKRRGGRGNSSRDKHTKPPPAPSNLRMSESLSTIRTSERESCSSEVQEVYSELQQISQKLKEEYKVLQERTVSVKERERMVTVAEARFQDSVETEVRRRMALREQELQLEIERLESALREKNKENKRLQENFNTLKTANDVLRREVESLTSQHEKLEKQSQSLQARLINLQRKQEHEDRKEVNTAPEVTKSRASAKRDTRERHVKSRSMSGNDVMGLLLEWVSDFHLRLAISDQPSKLPTCPHDFIQEKCLKIMPQLVEILKEVATQNSKFVLPCLQFMYWALLHLDQGKGHQKSALSSTLRRLGEELYRPRPARIGESETERPQEAFFFRSQDNSIRFLSSLIILKTISQVDHLAHVFDVLRNDLKTEAGKELFIHYQATPIILYHLRPSNKALMNSALDIFLQLSMECEQLTAFLDSCSNESWFRSVAAVWRGNSSEHKVQEKLSIILQKLSKIKSNRKYFEVFGLTTSAQELVRTLSSDQDAAFLSLNLKSILFNLNANKPVTS